jgi:hypothetical protein
VYGGGDGAGYGGPVLRSFGGGDDSDLLEPAPSPPAAAASTGLRSGGRWRILLTAALALATSQRGAPAEFCPVCSG